MEWFSLIKEMVTERIKIKEPGTSRKEPRTKRKEPRTKRKEPSNKT
jgi:hypothetical protein